MNCVIPEHLILTYSRIIFSRIIKLGFKNVCLNHFNEVFTSFNIVSSSSTASYVAICKIINTIFFRKIQSYFANNLSSNDLVQLISSSWTTNYVANCKIINTAFFSKIQSYFTNNLSSNDLVQLELSYTRNLVITLVSFSDFSGPFPAWYGVLCDVFLN